MSENKRNYTAKDFVEIVKQDLSRHNKIFQGRENEISDQEAVPYANIVLQNYEFQATDAGLGSNKNYAKISLKNGNLEFDTPLTEKLQKKLDFLSNNLESKQVERPLFPIAVGITNGIEKISLVNSISK